MSRLLPLPVALPLAVAALAALSGSSVVRRLLSLSAVGGVTAYAALLVAATGGGRVLTAEIGDWSLPLGIVLAADRLSALMVLTSGAMVLVAVCFAIARSEDDAATYHPLVLILTAGVGGALLTADLFNLFVFFEMMLIASYVLLVWGVTPRQVHGGAVYVTTNLLASTLLLIGVALIYGQTGTVNIAVLAVFTQTTGTFAVGGGLVLVAFAVKASLVPVHGWLPRTYPVAPPAVAALFSGLLTKVGVYAIYRVYATVLDGEPRLRGMLLVVAAATMILGVLGAVGRNGMREILAFHMVSQIGYILMGLGLFGPLGLAAGIFYMLQYIVVKASLFLVAGAVETLRGTGALDRLGGLARVHPVLAATFAVSALSLSGIPPLSGFFGKLLLVRAAFEEAAYLAAAAAVAVSFFTLLSMVKIWNGVFWGEPPAERPAPDAAEGPAPTGAASVDRTGTKTRHAALVAPAAALALVTIGLGLGAEGLHALVADAAGSLLDPAAYVRAVVGR